MVPYWTAQVDSGLGADPRGWGGVAREHQGQELGAIYLPIREFFTLLPAKNNHRC